MSSTQTHELRENFILINHIHIDAPIRTRRRLITHRQKCVQFFVGYVSLCLGKCRSDDQESTTVLYPCLLVHKMC